VESSRYEPFVARSGFTRGPDSCDRSAFAGLWQVRESARFGGIPIIERLAG
jgi:hypothetical protein